MSKWKTYKLGDFAELRKEQIIPKGIEQPYIGLEHIEQQSLRLNGVGSSKDVISNKYKFYDGDILYGKLRPYFRKVYQPKFDGVCSTDIYVIKNKKGFDKTFLYYLVATEEFTSFANSGSSGTRMPRADWKQLEKSEWDIPNLVTQIQIGEILSSLDDKIELLQQMNQTLENIAQAIFKEWFVDFNFPGFDGELIDGLPKGWKMGKVKDVYKTTSGGTPSRVKGEYYENGTINWVKSKELNGNFIFDTEEKITEKAVKNSSAKLIPKHSILLAMYGATVGEYAITGKETTCNQAICAVIEKEFPYSYFFEYFKNNRNSIIGRASGSAQQNISQALIQQLEILIPSIETVNNYHLVVEPLFNKMEENLLQIQTLTQTRDTLLPKLMSGQLEIKN